MDQALQNVNNVVFAKSFEESTDNYTKWSEVYDNDLTTLGCEPSLETAKMFEKYGMNSKMLLDVGGGTAAVVDLLRKAGYQGTVDILDANLNMLVQGEKKQIGLRNIIRHYVNDEGILPLKDESYDAMTCAGSFGPNHIPATALEGVIKVLKKGGIFVVTSRSNSIESYKQEFDDVLNKMKSEGKLEVLEEKEFSHFKVLKSDVKSIVYVFRKL